MSKSFLVDALLTKNDSTAENSSNQNNEINDKKLWSSPGKEINDKSLWSSPSLPPSFCLSPHVLCRGSLGISDYVQRNFFSYASAGLGPCYQNAHTSDPTSLRTRLHPSTFENGTFLQAKKQNFKEDQWSKLSVSPAVVDTGE
ncbi:GS homeobox 1 [Nephila pilipes]|uniref:GS homeobox 1 n=1 Tax=Nephila pilipes TaxID=299642 RepID=A0A8X6MWB2_NEPPI|nr:GS homeobox 1 [Nephila pilipes]